jgi:Arc/MetJ-type ribon-helix-helix transcriptional regulator
MNISLPADMLGIVKKRAEEAHFATLSEYIRHLIRLENTEKLAKELHQEKQYIESGKSKLSKKLAK